MLRLNSANIAAFLLPLALVACGDNPGNDDPRTRPPLVRSAPVESAIDTSRAFTGVVVARTQSDLGFRVQGKILERLVDTGQSVKRGQPLMRLRSMATKISLSLQSCVCFQIQRMPRPAHLRRGTCLKACWRTRRWVRP